MSTPKIVKRYANRKLYDTERSCYVTLEDISSMIKAGDEIRVMDNKSGEDLTSVTLAQIIFETEKKKNFMPLSLLRRLIREGGDAIGIAREQVVGTVHAKAEVARGTISEITTRAYKTLEDLQRTAEERLRSVGGLARYPQIGGEIDEIRKRLKELEERVGKASNDVQ